MNKPELRAHLRALLESVPVGEFTRAGRAAAAHLASRGVFRTAGAVGLFLSGLREIDTAPLLRRCLGDGKRVAVPAWHDAQAGYRMAWLESRRGSLRPGRFGLPEPVRPRWVGADELPLLLVPGLGFDDDGGRIGRGRGFYDRLLRDYTGLRIGLGLELQFRPAIPMDENDERIDAGVSEAGFHPGRRAVEDFKEQPS